MFKIAGQDDLNEKERESERIIEKLKQFDDMVQKKDDKIQTLENKMKDANLKIFEQSKEIDLINKKLRSLKDNDNKAKDLEVKFEILVKKVDNIITPSQGTNSEIHANNGTLEIVENKCEKCDFIAKNEQGLKIHIKAKHTEPQKFKCYICDFSSGTKAELTEHNDVYWYSHRMCLNPRRKKEYLEEFDQLKLDGFTVKEKVYEEVLTWKD